MKTSAFFTMYRWDGHVFEYEEIWEGDKLRHRGRKDGGDWLETPDMKPGKIW